MAGLAVGRRVLDTTAVQYFNGLATMAVGFVTTVVLSRYLGVERFGRYGLIIALVSVFQAFTDWGLTTVGLRQISRQRGDASRLIGSLMLFRLALSVAAVGGAWVITPSLGYPDEVRIGVGIFALTLLIGPLETAGLVLQADLRTHPLVLANLAGLGLNLAAIVMGVLMGWELLPLLALCTAALAVKGALTYLVARRTALPAFVPDIGLWWQFARAAAPVGLAAFFVMLYNRLDLLLLAHLSSEVEVGLYSAVSRLLVVVAVIPHGLIIALYPLMSRYAGSDKAALQGVYRQSVTYMALAGFGLGAGVTVFADGIVRGLFGHSFAAAAGTLQIAIWSSTCLYVAMVAGYLILAMGAFWTHLVLNGIGCSLNLALNLALIPRYGANGAAMALVATQLFLLIAASGVVCPRRFGVSLAGVPWVRVIATAGVTAVILASLKSVSVFLAVPAGLAVYAGLAVCLRCIPMEDLRAVQNWVLRTDPLSVTH